MRKSLFFFLCLISMITLVAVGCSKPAADQGAEQTGKTRTIEHAMGKTEVPEHPKRVVILTNEGTEALLALGVKPVGAVKSFTGNPWYKHLENELQGVKVVGDEHQPNLETIASLNPDLIIGNKMRQEKVYEQLSAIAPTVFAEELRGDWKVNFKLYAKALNKEAEGQKVLAAYDQKVKQVKENAGDLLKQKVSIVRFLAGKTRIYQLDSFSGTILKDIGFARPELQNKNEFAIEVTKERIPDMDGDILFYFTYETGDNNGNKQEQEWTRDPLWKNLNAVKNNRAFKVDDVIWNTAGGVKAANLMLDELNDYINKFKQQS
ncbi:ABC transporter substrate-binding protein [Paenactinomyces guangxiensis]|uniref:Iron-siderophore ABC transporter substrate-binding protein n=1 Tax=Paenactinomyces guangxiensis TaxID=1490290 RepID=A0A7W2A817_9BACL|nr:iron-siderophore ABC transporter substrate-binding protein [Paenactinomyces guangxiensis]MBA4493699.1 iron-siderophore ABC transporter substrate-binding protein [Paenactinomyces guangxiensis]MBH8590986.1 iron-siderophore ABC transporter substrate-binding protein [Paenactinomyces guangxiensis]